MQESRPESLAIDYAAEPESFPMPTKNLRLPPFSILTANQEHRADFIAAINRVLYDITHELNCELECDELNFQTELDTTELKGSDSGSRLPIRFVHALSQFAHTPEFEDWITVTPVPFRFSRSRQAWSQSAVLDWQQFLSEVDSHVDFHFRPDTLLAGHLYLHLEERGTLYDLISCISGTGESNHEDKRSDYYSYTKWLPGTNGRPEPDRDVQELRQEFPPEWESKESDDEKTKCKKVEVKERQLEQIGRIYLDRLKAIDRHSRRFIILLPVYDVRPYGQIYGDIVACLMLNIGFRRHATIPPPEVIVPSLRSKYERAVQDVVKGSIDRLTRLSELIAAEIHKAAIIEASTQHPEREHDLLEHFISCLRFAQSWEAAHVYRDNKPLYSYRWERNPELSGGDIWKRSDGFDADWLQREGLQAVFAPNGLPNCLSERISSGLPIDFVQEKDGAISWAAPEFFSANGSATDDLGELSSIQVIFEFTKTARIPTRDSDYRKAYCRELQFQQLDVLRAVRPAVRMRRAAVRNAVSAIMGRNMSHNIGSHVLARLAAAELEVDRKPGDRGTVAARTARQSLLSYLQKRMDFLAEVATADVCHWTQPVSLASALSRLNFDAEYRRNIGKEPKHAGRSLGERVKDTATEPAERPLLLSYITGKDDLVASVEFESSDQSSSDFLFSCPGGEVGAHALYVILENIIRNSARHGAQQQRPPSGAIVLSVSARSIDHSPHLIEIRIVDTHTRLDRDGRAGDGKPIPVDVNAALVGDGLLDADGRPNPKNWGVREMQICAHYLRSFPLSAVESRRFDLESHSPDDRAVLRAEAIEFNLSEEDGLTHRLGYVMYLQRPRLLAFLLDEDVRCGGVGQKPFDSSPELGILVCRIQTGDNADEALRVVAGYSAVIACGEGSVAALRRAEACPVAGDVEDGVDVGQRSRGRIQAAASSPEGAAGRDHESAARARLRAELPMVRITLNEDELVSLVDRIRSDEKPGTMQWMDVVFDKLGHRYLTRREHLKDLKTRKLHGVWAVDEKSRAAAPTPGAFVEGKVVVAPRISSGYFRPLTNDWRQTLRSLQSNPESFLGAAWLDHADVGENDEIESSNWQFWEAFRLPSQGEQGTERWISVEPDFFECAHRHHRERIRTNNNGGGSSEILAAATARVAILDERVQKALPESVRLQPLRRWWAGTGVWVPERDECNLDYPDWKLCQRFLQEPTALRWQWPIDILVIHLTILEKLRSKMQAKQPNISLDECLTDLRAGTSAEGDTEVVVVTGRGVTGTSVSHRSDRIETARFLPISALHEHVVTRPSKLGLMRALWSARRVKSGG